MRAIETKVAQGGVAIEHRAPPLGSTWEDFPNLPIDKAAKLLYPSKPKQPKSRGDVPFEAWSKEDQKSMLRGEKPKGIPDHPNG